MSRNVSKQLQLLFAPLTQTRAVLTHVTSRSATGPHLRSAAPSPAVTQPRGAAPSAFGNFSDTSEWRPCIVSGGQSPASHLRARVQFQASEVSRCGDMYGTCNEVGWFVLDTVLFEVPAGVTQFSSVQGQQSAVGLSRCLTTVKLLHLNSGYPRGQNLLSALCDSRIH